MSLPLDAARRWAGPLYRAILRTCRRIDQDPLRRELLRAPLLRTAPPVPALLPAPQLQGSCRSATGALQVATTSKHDLIVAACLDGAAMGLRTEATCRTFSSLLQ